MPPAGAPQKPHSRTPHGHGHITSAQRGEPWMWRWKTVWGFRGASALNACVHAVHGGAGAGTGDKIEVSCTTSRYLAIFHIAENLRECIHVYEVSVRECVSTKVAPTPHAPPSRPTFRPPHTHTNLVPAYARLADEAQGASG